MQCQIGNNGELSSELPLTAPASFQGAPASLSTLE